MASEKVKACCARCRKQKDGIENMAEKSSKRKYRKEIYNTQRLVETKKNYHSLQARQQRERAIRFRRQVSVKDNGE